MAMGPREKVHCIFTHCDEEQNRAKQKYKCVNFNLTLPLHSRRISNPCLYCFISILYQRRHFILDPTMYQLQQLLFAINVYPWRHMPQQTSSLAFYKLFSQLINGKTSIEVVYFVVASSCRNTSGTFPTTSRSFQERHDSLTSLLCFKIPSHF